MKLRMNRIGIGVVFFFFLATFFLGDALAQSVPKETIKIGCSLPLNISFGVEIKKALDASVDMINQEGGLTIGKKAYKIELVTYDDKYKAEPAISATHRLINNDKVKALVGNVGAAPILASIPFAQQAGIPMFCSSGSEKVANPKFKSVYITSMNRSIDLLYVLLIKARPDIKTAVIAGQDDETGRDEARRVAIILNQRGIKILATFFFPRDMRDYTSVATRASSLKPDLLSIPGFGGTAEKMGLMSKALYDTDWRGVTMVAAASVVKDLTNICPRGEAEGLYMPLADLTVLRNPPPLAIKVRKAYEQKYGEWRETGPSWTLPFWFWMAAVKKADSFDPAKLDKVMAGLEVETPIGMARMIKRPDLGNPKYVDSIVTPSLGQVKGKNVVAVSSMTIKEAINELEKIHGFKGQWE